MKYEKNPNTKCTCSNWKHHAKWILNEKNILKSIETVLSSGDIEKLSNDAYNFLHISSGFIAHYNKNGFMDYYRNTEDLRTDIANSSDVQNAERYINDDYFSKNEQSEYYAQKTRIYQTLKTMVEKYADTSKNKEMEIVKDKISLLETLVAKAKTDDVFAKQILQKLSLI